MNLSNTCSKSTAHPSHRATRPPLAGDRPHQAVCGARGAKLFVIALPLDVMVSSDEWNKCGGPPIDMSASKVLIDDLLKKAELVGARGFDLPHRSWPPSATRFSMATST